MKVVALLTFVALRPRNEEVRFESPDLGLLCFTLRRKHMGRR
jgi:hypothetical protein